MTIQTKMHNITPIEKWPLTLTQTVSLLETVYSDSSTPTLESSLPSGTYGEILPQSLPRVLKAFGLRPNDVLLDLGAGLGRAALGFFLLSALKKVIGIEINSAWGERCQRALAQAQALAPNGFESRQMVFLTADFLKVPLDPEGTLVYCASTCFEEGLIQALCRKLDTLPTIRMIATLKPLPYLKQYRYRHQIKVDCSWDSSLCFFYAR